ncbi:unnamed protein product [Caenorhabditis nigoni]
MDRLLMILEKSTNYLTRIRLMRAELWGEYTCDFTINVPFALQVTICHWSNPTILLPTLIAFYTMNRLLTTLEKLTNYLTRIRVLSIEEFVTPHL